jgi:hypothetical protein
LTEIFVALLNTILELSIILEQLHDDALNGGGEGGCHIASRLSANEIIAEVGSRRPRSKWDTLSGSVECVV